MLATTQESPSTKEYSVDFFVVAECCFCMFNKEHHGIFRL